MANATILWTLEPHLQTVTQLRNYSLSHELTEVSSTSTLAPRALPAWRNSWQARNPHHQDDTHTIAMAQVQFTALQVTEPPPGSLWPRGDPTDSPETPLKSLYLGEKEGEYFFKFWASNQVGKPLYKLTPLLQREHASTR